MSTPTLGNPEAVAEACAKAMWQDDRASKSLGMRIQGVGPGEAVLSMTVRKDMTNGHGICHGGFIFTLADSAFACNTYDQRTVAQHCAVTFLQSAQEGDVLTAHALERTRAQRSGIYDVTVRRGDTIIAEFRGHSRTIAGQLLASSSDDNGQ
jgi:acyl-CoA thioesterase